MFTAAHDIPIVSRVRLLETGITVQPGYNEVGGNLKSLCCIYFFVICGLFKDVGKCKLIFYCL